MTESPIVRQTECVTLCYMSVTVLDSPISYEEEQGKPGPSFYLENGIKSCGVVTPPLKNITICLPDGKRVSASERIITDPATGMSTDLGAVFE